MVVVSLITRSTKKLDARHHGDGLFVVVMEMLALGDGVED